MKKKIYFVVAMGICFSLLMNCAKPDLDPIGMELEEGVPFGKKQLSITKVDAQTVAKNPRMQKTMQNIQGKSLAKMQANGRTLEDTGYFKLQMTDIVMVEKGGYTSYTFAVLREQDSGYMENIIVNLYADGTMKTYFVEYDFTEAEKMALINYGNIPSDPKSQAYLMDNLEDIFSNNSVLRFAQVYNEILCPRVSWVNIVNYCPSGQHSESDHQNCAYYKNGSWDYIPPVYTTTVVTYEPCSGGGGGNGGGGGGSGNDSSPPNGNPADSTPPNDPNDPSDPELVNNDGDVHTVPVPPKEVPKTPHEKNCEKLNQQAQAINESLIDLSAKAGLNDKEYAYYYNVNNEVNENNEIIENYTSTEICNHPPCTPIGSNSFSVPFPEGQNAVAVAHTHPDDGLGYLMFSPQDIQYLWALALRHQPATPPRVASVYTLYLVTERGNYALKIDNFIQFHSFMTAKYNADFVKKLEQKYEERNVVGPMPTMADFEKDFLEFVKSYSSSGGMGLSLYKTNDNFSEWNKLSLNENNDVASTPCINQ